MSHESDPFEISKLLTPSKKARNRSAGLATGSVVAGAGAAGATKGYRHHTWEASYRENSTRIANENVKFWRDKGRSATYTAQAEHRAGRPENAKLYANEARSYIPKMNENHAHALHQNAKAIKHLGQAKNFKRAAIGAAGAGVGLAAASAYQAARAKKLQPKSNLAKALNAAQQKQRKKANRWGLGAVGGYGVMGTGAAVGTHHLSEAEDHKWNHDVEHNEALHHQSMGRTYTQEARRQAGFGPGHHAEANKLADMARAHIKPMHAAQATEFEHGAKALTHLRNAKIGGAVAVAGAAGMIGAAVKAGHEQKKVKALRTPRAPKTPIAKNDPFEIVKFSQDGLKRQKRAQAKINVAGATLGIGALGALGAGKAARPALRTAKSLGVLRPMVNEAKTDKFVAGAEKVRNTALTVGAGVGGVGGYNSASIMRAEGGKKKTQKTPVQ